MKTLFAFLLLLSVAACGSDREEYEIAGDLTPYVRLSAVQPPEAPYEEKQASPEPMREIWRPGFWDFDGKAFTWVPGQLIPRPDPTATWSGERWEERIYGWAFVPGYWQ